MKNGMALDELAIELQRQQQAKRDWIAPTQKLSLVNDTDQGVVILGLNGPMGLTTLAHDQVAAHAEIPRPYYQRMLKEAPDLLTSNVNTWWSLSQDKRMVRALDGQVRAWLSDRYRPLDNSDLAEAVLPILADTKAQIRSVQITDTRFYLKASLPTLTREVRGAKGLHVGDMIEALVTIRNSEVGHGRLAIETGGLVLRCLNGMTGEASFKKLHVGRGHETAEDALWQLLRDETRKADDRAVWMKVRDVTRAAFDETRFATFIGKLEEATTRQIVTDDIPQVVEATVQRLALPPASGPSILTHLIRGGDLSAYGLAQAVTAASQERTDYEEATELEVAGGRIVELPRQDWIAIAEGRVIRTRQAEGTA